MRKVTRTFQSHLPTLMRRRAAELDKEITQEIIAREVGLGQATISRWYNGQLREIDADTVARLMVYFGCKTLNDLVSVSLQEIGNRLPDDGGSQ